MAEVDIMNGERSGMDKKDPKFPTEINSELIYYMFGEIKKELGDIKKEYVTKAESALLRQEIHNLRQDFADHKRETVKELEIIKGKKQVKETILWAGLVASALINIIALYRLFTK